MARATIQNTRSPLDIQDPDPAEMAVLRYFREHGLKADESRRQSAFSSWMAENVPKLDAEARAEAFNRLIKKGWVGTNRSGAVWVTQEGWREANK